MGRWKRKEDGDGEMGEKKLAAATVQRHANEPLVESSLPQGKNDKLGQPIQCGITRILGDEMGHGIEISQDKMGKSASYGLVPPRTRQEAP